MAHQQHEVAVIGAGITGLSAAWELVNSPGVTVTVFESSDVVGGKLRISDVAGVPVDEGAESMLAARPEAIRLADEVGLRPSIVHPAVREAAVLSRRALRRLPPGLVTGVPTDLRALAASRILSVPSLLRIPVDQMMGGTPIGDDVSVGDYLATRLGREVVDRLAEPLLAGVYAGNPYELSFRMANPSLFRQAGRDSSLLNAARAVSAGAAQNAGARRGPVFAGIRGGVGRLASKTAAAVEANGGMIRTGQGVTRIRRVRHRWEISTPSEVREYDAVVLAVPADVAATLVRTSAPFAALQIRGIDYASVAVVTLAYRAGSVSGLAGSGFLVPPVEGFNVKGVTYATSKWEWLGRDARSSSSRGLVLVRASFGRSGDEAVLELDDDALADLAREELHQTAGLPPVTVDQRVTRWSRALPQYRVGHVDLVTRARDALLDSPGLALAGAGYDGVGIASCVASGRQAVKVVRRHLEENAEQAHG